MPTIKECRELLDIQSRDTINEDLKALGLFGNSSLSWSEVRRVLEIRVFLGIKPGIHSREKFNQTPKEELERLFQKHQSSIEQKLEQLQHQYKNRHRVTVHLTFDRD
jgi:DNA-binding transcriptional MerR regulator